MAIRRKRLGEILLDIGAVASEQLEEAVAHQERSGGLLGEVLVKLNMVEPADVTRALALQFDLPMLEEIPLERIDTDLIASMPIGYAKGHGILPLYREGSSVHVVMSDPLKQAALGDVQAMLGAYPRVSLAEPERVLEAINWAYDKASKTADSVIADIEEEDFSTEIQHLEEITDLLDDPNEAPIIRFVNSLLTQAVKDRASDIHIEPFERDLSVRFRIDGVLYEVVKPSKRLQAAIISRVKIMSGLNIAERRLPQDGRIRIKIAGRDIDIRTSTVPVTHGERVVMRLLDRTQAQLGLGEVGLAPDKLETFRALIRKPHGIILVTGPTGSGKTTTLYAALTEINSPELNILTVEDPVEYQLQGIGQMQVNPKIDLTFASGLRSFLRQDPDVIMVGEIRDGETADIAIQASLTGHLVLSTLHTNDAAGAVTRLIDMGVEPFLVSSSLLAIMAQRLVRKVCPECRRARPATGEELERIGLTQERIREITAQIDQRELGEAEKSERLVFYHSVGCSECLGTGYRGRTGIYELLPIDDDIRGLILSGVDSATIKKRAVEKGMLTLRDDGVRKALAGTTTLAEVLRVTQEDQIEVG